jgi:hypothetical protein
MKTNSYTVSSFSAKMAEIRSKTVGYAQFKFDQHFWSKFRQNWSKYFQTSRISSESANKKPAMGLISTKMNEIRPKMVVEFELRVFDHFGGKQNYCVINSYAQKRKERIFLHKKPFLSGKFLGFLAILQLIL